MIIISRSEVTYIYYSKPGLIGLGWAGPDVKPGPEPSQALCKASSGLGSPGLGRAGLGLLSPARTSLTAVYLWEEKMRTKVLINTPIMVLP